MVITSVFIVLAIIFIFLLVKFIKNKNYKAIIIMFAIIIVCLLYYMISRDYDYKVVYDGYISEFDSIIISNIDEYNEFVSDSDEWGNEYKQDIIYNKNYFLNKSLALIFINTGSGMNKFIDADISVKDNVLIVKPNIEYANGTVTMDITGKLILVEIDKNITSIEVQR